MCASDVKIDNIAFRLIHLVNSSFLFFPCLFLKFELVNLLIFLAYEFNLVLYEFYAFLFKGISFLSNQVLKVDHEFLDELISASALSSEKIFLYTVLGEACCSLILCLSSNLGSRWIQINRAAFTAHLTEQHFYSVLMLIIIAQY